MTKIQVDNNGKAIMLGGKALMASEGGASGIGIPREVSANGVYQMPAENFTFSLPSNATSLGNFALYYAFRGCTSLTSVDLSSLTSIGDTFNNYSLHNAFMDCTNLTSVDLSSLISIGSVGLSGTFSGCTSLTSVDLSSLTTISLGNSNMGNAFLSCTSLTSVSFPSLNTLTANVGMAYAFNHCSSLASLSFPALNSTSFGSYTNQFNNMLYQVTGCTVHFPSNLQSVIGSWSDVTAGFGGTNTTVLFDLPATT